MARFSRRSLPQIIKRVQNDLETRVPGLIAKVKRTFEFGVAYVLGGLSHSLHGHLDHVANQILPDTSDEEHLLRQGAMFKIPRKQATPAGGKIQVKGTVGANVPANSVWEYLGAEGNPPQYKNPLAAVIGEGGFIIVDVVAVEPGAQGNVAGGEVLSLVESIPNIVSESPVVEYAPIQDGTDIEKLDPDYRNRVLARYGNPPKGGGPGDWIQWALSVNGVSRAWELGSVPEPGKVTVLIVNDKTDPPSPSPQLIIDAQAYIQGKAPICSTPVVKGPELVALDPVIKLDTDTQDLRKAIAKELDDLVTNNDYRDGTLKLSLVNDAIGDAPGWEGHNLVSPILDVEYGAQEIPVVGVISWA